MITKILLPEHIWVCLIDFGLLITKITCNLFNLWFYRVLLFLHNGNVYPSVPAICPQERNIQNLELLLTHIPYTNHNRDMCGDLKVVVLQLKIPARTHQVTYANRTAVQEGHVTSDRNGHTVLCAQSLLFILGRIQGGFVGRGRHTGSERKGT